MAAVRAEVPGFAGVFAAIGRWHFYHTDSCKELKGPWGSTDIRLSAAFSSISFKNIFKCKTLFLELFLFGPDYECVLKRVSGRVGGYPGRVKHECGLP
jgi:hypothetical protein